MDKLSSLMCCKGKGDQEGPYMPTVTILSSWDLAETPTYEMVVPNCMPGHHCLLSRQTSEEIIKNGLEGLDKESDEKHSEKLTDDHVETEDEKLIVDEDTEKEDESASGRNSPESIYETADEDFTSW